MTFQTQMQAARSGVITKEMIRVAEKEAILVEDLRQLIAEGQVIIPANRNHFRLNPEGIGKNLRTKLND